MSDVKLTAETVIKVAKLARLEVPLAEAQTYAEQLSKALGFFEQISEVKTDGVAPLVTPTEIPSFWRDDEPKQELTAEEILKNAPSRVGNLFSVPPVV